MIKTLARSFALAALAVAALPAQAEDRVQTVSLAGIDAGTPAGAKLLNTRIARAVENVCGSYAEVESPEIDQVTRCRRTTLAAVHQQLAALRHPATELAAR